jgi:NADPH:quinone reductase-like Zn-dependent oxidoreductase
MKAAIVAALGQPPVCGDFPNPAPREGAEFITVSASAVSQLARSRASGSHYSSEDRFPFVSGFEGVGRLANGARVYFMLPQAPYGAFAERTLVASAHCLPLPDGLDDITAAAIANPGMSSTAAFGRARLLTGETVLINGATGVAGRLAVQIAKRWGAKKVIATGRNLAALDAVQALGADVTITLRGDGADQQRRFADAFREGVDVVIDYLWGASAEALLTSAAKVGASRPLRFVQVGSASGGEINLPSAVLRSIPIELIGSGLGSVSFERLKASIGEVFNMAAMGGLSMQTRRYPFAEFAAAWAAKDGDARAVVTFDVG